VEELKRILGEAGFTDIVVQEKDNTDEIIRSWNFGEDVLYGICQGKETFRQHIGPRSHLHFPVYKLQTLSKKLISSMIYL
jgi:hypothetical protein